MEKKLKFWSVSCYALGMLTAALLLTHRTFGYRDIIQIVFFLAGIAGIILSLLQYRYPSEGKNENEFNILYWLGTATIFLGLAFRIKYLPYSQFFIIAGSLFMTVSFFYNPFKKAKQNNNDLLDN